MTTLLVLSASLAASAWSYPAAAPVDLDHSVLLLRHAKQPDGTTPTTTGLVVSNDDRLFLVTVGKWISDGAETPTVMYLAGPKDPPPAGSPAMVFVSQLKHLTEPGAAWRFDRDLNLAAVPLKRSSPLTRSITAFRLTERSIPSPPETLTPTCLVGLPLYRSGAVQQQMQPTAFLRRVANGRVRFSENAEKPRVMSFAFPIRPGFEGAGVFVATDDGPALAGVVIGSTADKTGARFQIAAPAVAVRELLSAEGP